LSNAIQHPAVIASSYDDMSALTRTLYLESNSDIPGIVHKNTNLLCITFHTRWSSTC